MYKKVLLAYDGTTEGRRALREGAKLAQMCGAEVLLLAVVDISPGLLAAEGTTSGAIEQQQEAYEEILQEGVRRLESVGFKPESRLAIGDPAERIGKVAKEIGADLVVVGHRQRSALVQWWAGSVASDLVSHLSCSLLIGQKDLPDEAFQVVAPTA